MAEASASSQRNGCLVCGAVTPLSHSIDEIFAAFEEKRLELVEGGTVYMCRTDQLIPFLKHERRRDNALAPGRAKNCNEVDVAKGQQKWDALRQSIHDHGFRVTSQIVFIVFKRNTKRRIHQGHHRVGVALAEKLEEIPVVFHFIPQKQLQPANAYKQ